MQVDIGHSGNSSGYECIRNAKQARIVEEAQRQWDRHPEVRAQYETFERFVRSLEQWTFTA